MIARQLFEIRNKYEPLASADKLSLLSQLDQTKLKTASDVKLLHSALCFIRAFPDTPAHYRLAHAELARMEHRVDVLAGAEQTSLWDSGIIGTPVHYRFSYEVARWLERRVPGTVSIDWEDMHDPPGLDEILTHLLQPSEDEYFDSGHVSGREWIELASAKSGGTDFDWLLAQLKERRFATIWAQLYNAAELWLTWNLRGSALSKSLNAYPVKKIHARTGGMRKLRGPAKAEIMRPIGHIARLSQHAGSKMIDVAMASLAVRHRETYHFNHASSREVYLADVGCGTAVAVFGLQRRHRFPLECTLGYLILGNGMPIGYGGSSVLFRQVNTGLNVFDDYRGSEAAFLWVQVMRVYHHITGCSRYIANPYQFGAENDEALQSGAFWFYYRLGYRPVAADVRQLASREFAKSGRNKRYRSDIKTLRRLASCDMHLTLPGAKQSDLFDERWIETSSMLATKVLAEADGRTRRIAATRVAQQLAADLGLRSFAKWSASERNAFERIAPIAAAANPKDWSPEAKKSMRELLRAKGGDREARYARLIGQHQAFLQSLRKACRRAEFE
ncbi:MAG: hypothetical protein ACR2Q3_18160 [Woeseiaceae bacterium]